MRTITHPSQQRPTDVRVEPSGPGTWLVYEPGDPLPPVIVTPEEREAEAKRAAEEARTDAEAFAVMKDPKLQAIAKMTPEEVRAWVQASVKDLAQTHDVVATLAVAVSVLSRRALTA